MKNDLTYYVDLITRYFSGEASSEEMVVLSEWIKSSTENQKLFEEYQKTWMALEESRINAEIDVDEEWEKIKPLINSATVSKETKHIPVIPLHAERTAPWNFFYKAVRIAAIFIVIASISFIVYYYLNQSKEKYLVAQTETIESKLPDGTSVTLNAGSTLKYPDKFKGNKRTVALKGEAYFNVTHDETKPFIIEANDVRVKVLGTSFYVNTNSSNGQGEVILTSGRVAVYYDNNPDKITILNPGEKAIFSKTEQKIIKTENDEINYMAFKTKDLVFSNTALSDVVKTLNNVYHSNIKLKNTKIASYTLSGNYENLKLDSILKVIQEALPVNISKSSGNVIEISGNGGK
ncbi:MAG: FecR domain-containing protein [Bacteroidales bacterium]|jgi:ferric-dicitrate binding protein FerR (iron transport regulator)